MLIILFFSFDRAWRRSVSRYNRIRSSPHPIKLIVLRDFTGKTGSKMLKLGDLRKFAGGSHGDTVRQHKPEDCSE